MTIPTPERTTDAPAPEATLEDAVLAAMVEVERLGRHYSDAEGVLVLEIRTGRLKTIIKCALDTFAKAAVEKERARCLAHVADVVRNANGKSSGPTRVRIAAETISRRIAKGWAAS